jgi:hypothetical protein
MPNPEPVSEAERRQWWAEFEAAARRPLEQRMKYAFVKTYKPVLDDAPYRAFDTMEDYRRAAANRSGRVSGLPFG